MNIESDDRTNRLTVAILAGGRSRRMGRDKALLAIDGEMLLDRIVRAALATELPVMVVGRARPAEWEIETVRFVEDAAPDSGPLGGIVTGLGAAGSDLLAVACDMPLVDAAALRWLIERYDAIGKRGDGLVTLREGRMEPLFSIYAARSLPWLSARLRRSELALRDAIEEGSYEKVEAPPAVAGRLLNINTPADLDALNRLLASDAAREQFEK